MYFLQKDDIIRAVASGGAGGALAPPVFCKTVNPISTRGDRLCPPQYYEPPGFSDLATGLHIMLILIFFDTCLLIYKNRFLLPFFRTFLWSKIEIATA